MINLSDQVDFYREESVLDYQCALAFTNEHYLIELLHKSAIEVLQGVGYSFPLFCFQSRLRNFEDDDTLGAFFISDIQRHVDAFTLRWVNPQEDFLYLAEFGNLDKLRDFVEDLIQFSKL